MFAPAPRIGRNNVLFLNGPTYAYKGMHIDHISKVEYESYNLLYLRVFKRV